MSFSFAVKGVLVNGLHVTGTFLLLTHGEKTTQKLTKKTMSQSAASYEDVKDTLKHKEAETLHRLS